MGDAEVSAECTTADRDMGIWCGRISSGAFSYRDATLRWFLVIFFAMVIGLILALHYGLVPR
jgi:hypothetical protein